MAFSNGLRNVTSGSSVWTVGLGANDSIATDQSTTPPSIILTVDLKANNADLITFSSSQTSGGTLIKPGSGSFTDATGHVYTIDAQGNATEDGQLMDGGGGTGAMEYANGIVYGQDAASGTWYDWTQVTWELASAPPPSGSSSGASGPFTANVQLVVKNDTGTTIDGFALNLANVVPTADYAFFSNIDTKSYGGNLGLFTPDTSLTSATGPAASELAVIGTIAPGATSTGDFVLHSDSDFSLAVFPDIPTFGPPVGGGGSGSSNFVTPGSGSFTDSAGHVYTIDGNGNAIEDGKLMDGGGGTGAMEYANGVVYGQDAASGTWYDWTQVTWELAKSAPPPPSGGSGGPASVTLPSGDGTWTINAPSDTTLAIGEPAAVALMPSLKLVVTLTQVGTDTITFIAPPTLDVPDPIGFNANVELDVVNNTGKALSGLVLSLANADPALPQNLVPPTVHYGNTLSASDPNYAFFANLSMPGATLFAPNGAQTNDTTGPAASKVVLGSVAAGSTTVGTFLLHNTELTDHSNSFSLAVTST